MHIKESCSVISLVLAHGADILRLEAPVVNLCTSRKRGHMPDVDWLESNQYKKLSKVYFINHYTWNILWDILRLLSSRRAMLGLYVILTHWRTRGAKQRPLLHIGARRATHYVTGKTLIWLSWMLLKDPSGSKDIQCHEGYLTLPQFADHQIRHVPTPVRDGSKEMI